MPRKPRPSELAKRAANPRKTPEEIAAIARENGKKGGRPEGSRDVLPRGAVKALRTAKFRVKKEYSENPEIGEHVTEVAGYGFERIVDVLAGRVHSRKAPSVLKAAIAVREETCEPVVKESRLSGSIGIASAVAAAAAKINGEEPKE